MNALMMSYQLTLPAILRRAEQLKKVREFEKNNKNRETLIEQIDRKIRTNNS